MDPSEFAAALRADILALADAPDTAHERRRMDFTPGAYAPACGDHDMMRSNKGVYLTAVARRNREVRFLDVFRAWLHNDDGRRRIVAARSDRADAVCPD